MSEDFNHPTNSDFEEQSHIENEELSHLEKLSGILTAPAETFSTMSEHKPRIIDWLLPILLLIVVSILSNFVMMNVPDLKNQIIEDQMEIIKENFEKQVENGNMTTEEAETQFNKITEKMNNGGGMGMIGSGIGIVFGVFLFFFLVSLVFFIIARFIFKDEGTYSQALVAYGFPSYITAFQVILILLISIVSGNIVSSTSLNAITGGDPLTIGGFIMAKIDPMRIWYYLLISIAFARMFKSENTTKYIITIFSLWIGFSLIILYIAQSTPWLGRFIM